jgi:CRISPR-associated protein (TIGR03986 family)
MSKDRTYFINPYTFVPLDEKGPVRGVQKQPPGNAHHLYFDKDCHTGKMKVELQFVTPAVIPGKQEPGTEKKPGEIELYRHNGKLAIPGSRLRGHFFNLMKAINSSPISTFNDRAILERASGNHKKGYIIEQNNEKKIVEIKNEILMASHDRKPKPNLSNGTCKDKPILDNGKTIPDFDINNPIKGETGTLHFGNPIGPGGQYKRYLSDNKGKALTGTWVKFVSWSGQDGENELKDIRGGIKVHKVGAHIVKIKDITTEEYNLGDDVVSHYKKNVSEMAKLLQDRGEGSPAVLARMKRMSSLEPGTFVYFEANGNNVTSIGRHYRYLSQKGSIEDTIERTNGNFKPESCPIHFLGGFASDSDKSEGLKSRIWVGMAECTSHDPNIEKKDLRILSSQPPKSACFYLNGEGYAKDDSTVRGRKFYWHDSKWRQKRWDNIDMGKGDFAFENPLPKEENTKQWASSEVIMADDKNPVIFEFNIHFMNLSKDELFLLLTAIKGFVRKNKTEEWVHKIGHARPFMGSAIMKISSLETLSFNNENRLPQLIQDTVDNIIDKNLDDWQQVFQDKKHIKALKRIMAFGGAYRNAPEIAQIMYPVRNKTGRGEPNWENQNNSPKTFQWFAKQDGGRSHPPKLPDPGEEISQALLFNWSSDQVSGRNPGRGGHKKKFKSYKGGKRR